MMIVFDTQLISSTRPSTRKLPGRPTFQIDIVIRLGRKRRQKHKALSLRMNTKVTLMLLLCSVPKQRYSTEVPLMAVESIGAGANKCRVVASQHMRAVFSSSSPVASLLVKTRVCSVI